MSSAAATSFTCTPGKLLNFTAVALNRSPYFSILRGLAFATTHLQPVRPRCQLNRGKLATFSGETSLATLPHLGSANTSRNRPTGLATLGGYSNRWRRNQI